MQPKQTVRALFSAALALSLFVAAPRNGCASSVSWATTFRWAADQGASAGSNSPAAVSPGSMEAQNRALEESQDMLTVAIVSMTPSQTSTQVRMDSWRPGRSPVDSETDLWSEYIRTDRSGVPEAGPARLVETRAPIGERPGGGAEASEPGTLALFGLGALGIACIHALHRKRLRPGRVSH